MKVVYASRTGNVESIISKLGIEDALKVEDGSETVCLLYTSGTNYRNINLKDIQVPKKKEINILKIISLLKNNPDFSRELTSILK